MSTQVRSGSEVQTNLASILGGQISLWTTAPRSAQSFGEDSCFFPETETLPQTDHKNGCIRGILWAIGFQAAAVVVAIVVFKVLHAI
jgi:hypothetical protein